MKQLTDVEKETPPPDTGNDDVTNKDRDEKNIVPDAKPNTPVPEAYDYIKTLHKTILD